MNRFKIFITIMIMISLLAFISGCSIQEGKTGDTEKLKVITTLLPQYDFVREIAKDKADITLLLPPGVESHAYEPSPQDIVSIKKSNAFIYTGENMEPWVHKVIESTKDNKLVVIDTSKGIELIDEEEHHEEHEEDENHEGGEEDHHGGKDPYFNNHCFRHTCCRNHAYFKLDNISYGNCPAGS